MGDLAGAGALFEGRRGFGGRGREEGGGWGGGGALFGGGRGFGGRGGEEVALDRALVGLVFREQAVGEGGKEAAGGVGARGRRADGGAELDEAGFVGEGGAGVI